MNISRSQQPLFGSAAPKRSHLLLMVAFFFLIGCVSIFHIQNGWWLWALAFIGGALTALLRKSGMCCGLGIALLCFALGSLYAHAAYNAPMPAEDKYQLTGYVYGEPSQRTNSMVFVLGDLTLDGQPVSGKAYCSLHYEDEPPELFDGAKLSFSGRVYHPSGKTGEPGMDFRLWMRQKGYAFGVSTYEAPIVENTPENAPAKDKAFRVRQVFSAAFDRTMGANGRIAMALLFGDRNSLSDEEYTAFQDLGIAHIMSVSGLHVGLVGGMLLLALERWSLKRRTKLLIISFFLLDYCALTGFAAASVRAAVMLIYTSFGRLFHRRGDSLTTLAAAMLTVLMIDPLSAFSAGFVLSFSAMLGIMLYALPVLEKLDRLWPPLPINPKLKTKASFAAWLQEKIKSLFVISATAQLGVLLPTMRYFHQLPLYGIVVNLLIVPLAGSVLVPAYLATLAASLFPIIGQLIGSISSALTELMLQLVALLSRLPYAAVRTSAPPLIVCIGLGLALILLSRRVPGSLRTRMLAAALAAAVSLGGWVLQKPAQLRYIQLSVGQADAAILMDGKHTVVIDTGDDGSAVIDYLRHENRTVDALILTHLHLDHSGGAEAVLQSGVRVRHLYLPINAHQQKLDEHVLALYDRLCAYDIPVTMLASGDELRYNRSAVRVLWPERETVRSGHDANDYSLALAIDLDGYTLLHASDLTGLYELHAAVPADVLKAAHHGSSASTTDVFLDFVQPQFALLSVSGGSASLPGDDTLQRLNAHNVEFFRTDECGDVTISVQNGQLSVTPYIERTLP